MDKIDKILDKLDRIEEHLTQQRVSMAVLEQGLGQNTMALEKQNQEIECLEHRISKLEEHAHRWAGVGKALAILGVLSGIIAAFATLKGLK